MCGDADQTAHQVGLFEDMYWVKLEGVRDARRLEHTSIVDEKI